MAKNSSYSLPVAVLVAALSTAAMGQGIAERLDPPAAVPLEFLGWLGEDDSWLTKTLADQQAASGVEIAGGVATVADEASLRMLNRIRSFAHLSQPGLRLPYLDFNVTDGSGNTFRCVTLFARSVVPDIGPMDFSKPSLSAQGADPAILDMCRVDAKAEAFEPDRAAFRERYFDAAGDLRSEFRELNTNAAFIAAAIDHGFFVRQGDVTGRLRIDAE